MTMLSATTVWGAGPQLINETIVAPKVNGGSIMGAGAVPNIDPDGSTTGAATQIIWTGDHTGEAMLEARGTHFYINGFSLHGREWDADTGVDKAQIGFYLKRHGAGVGTGKMHIESIAITDCETGIRIGEAYNSLNTDTTYFDFLYLEDCDVGWHNLSYMGMGFNVQLYKAVNVTTHYRISAGGTINLTSGVIEGGGTFVHFPWDAGAYNITSAKGTYSFKNVLFSDESKPKILQMDGGGPISIEFSNITVVNTGYSGELLFEARGNSIVLIDGFVNLQPDTLKGYTTTSVKPVFVLRNNLVLRVSSLTELFAAGSTHVLIDGGGNRNSSNQEITGEEVS